jgi:putative membrane-bound dehydrogenase-like protein
MPFASMSDLPAAASAKVLEQPALFVGWLGRKLCDAPVSASRGFEDSAPATLSDIWRSSLQNGGHDVTRWVLLAGLFLPAASSAQERTPAPLPPAKAAASMVVPDGFKVTLVAAEPDVVQPISFTIDARGRLWVAEALNYGEWQATGKDRIVILEERPGGVKRTLFYEGFNYITGIEVGFGGVWVMSPPNLYFIPDRDGDDKPDGPPQVLFDGFGYKESRHNLANGFTWGPDGWLYGGHGRTSPSDVGRPGTPADRRTHCDGGVYRIHPTRLVFENFADGTTNPWGVDFDDSGECFVSNCVNPHLFHMIPGGHYEPWRNRPSSLYAYERLPTIADHLHYPGGDLRSTLGTADTLALGGGHAHCGMLIYLGDSFPKEYRNTAMMCNVHGRRINNDILKRKGSGYTAGHGKDFAISGDPWFMGVTLRTGPDGSVYVSDWSDTGECHTYKPEKGTGRIYKISYGEPRTRPVNLEKLTDQELVELQLHPNDFQVRHARRILQERAVSREPKSSEARAALRKRLTDVLTSNASPSRRLRALWALHATGAIDAEALVKLLDDPDEHVRAWAVRLLCESSPPREAPARFTAMGRHDPSPLVRLALASALQRLPLDNRWGIADRLVRHGTDTTDPNLPLMIWYGIEPLVAADPARALALALKTEIPLVRQFIARRAVDEALAKGGDLAPLVAAIGKADEKVARDLFGGMREGVRGRKSLRMPGGWHEVYARYGRSDDAALREHAVRLALVFGDPQALADLRKVALDPAAGAAGRVSALEALIETHVPDLAPVLHDQLSDKTTRRVALRGLAAYTHPDTARRVLAVYADLPQDEKQDAVAALSARPDSALALLEAVEAKAIPRTDVSAFAARQMFALGDAALTERLRRVWGEVRETNAGKQKQLARYKSLLTPQALKNADPRRGRAIFAAACANCHKLYGQGGVIGPDLTGSNRTDLDYLLSNLIDPSAEVGRDFRMSVVRTKDERTITGIVVERTPARITIQTDKERLILSPDDVDSVKDSPLSIMPEGQLDALSRDQVRDLFAYLTSKDQVPMPPEVKK